LHDSTAFVTTQAKRTGIDISHMPGIFHPAFPVCLFCDKGCGKIQI
jgi:hypothetical protein